MNLRFYIDPETNLPHIYKHGVNEVKEQQINCALPYNPC